MLEQIITPQNRQFLLQLPAEFIGKQVKVIAFEIENNSSTISNIPTSKHLRIKEIHARVDTCHVNRNNFKFNSEKANNYE